MVEYGCSFFVTKKSTVYHLASVDYLSLRLCACLCACFGVQEFRLPSIVVYSVMFHVANSKYGWLHVVRA